MSGGWNTIESDAGVFTHLLEELGVRGVQFEELISLDVESLQSLNPVYGVIFLFKWLSTQAQTDGPSDGSYDFDAADNIFFAKQTIQNACGTQALLSVLLNMNDIEIGTGLKDFKEFASPLPSDFRGECLSNSELIRDTHNSFSRASPFANETQRMATDDDDLYHFIAYSVINDILYELDGLQDAPISHGSCTRDQFPEKIVDVLQRRIARYPSSEVRFNLIAMIQDPRIKARQIGDVETLQVEERKRQDWIWENSLRRHNFVGFIGDLLKTVVKSKQDQGDEAYDKWIESAKQKTLERAKKNQDL